MATPLPQHGFVTALNEPALLELLRDISAQASQSQFVYYPHPESNSAFSAAQQTTPSVIEVVVQFRIQADSDGQHVMPEIAWAADPASPQPAAEYLAAQIADAITHYDPSARRLVSEPVNPSMPGGAATGGAPVPPAFVAPAFPGATVPVAFVAPISSGASDPAADLTVNRAPAHSVAAAAPVAPVAPAPMPPAPAPAAMQAAPPMPPAPTSPAPMVAAFTSAPPQTELPDLPLAPFAEASAPAPAPMPLAPIPPAPPVETFTQPATPAAPVFHVPPAPPASPAPAPPAPASAAREAAVLAPLPPAPLPPAAARVELSVPPVPPAPAAAPIGLPVPPAPPAPAPAPAQNVPAAPLVEEDSIDDLDRTIVAPRPAPKFSWTLIDSNGRRVLLEQFTVVGRRPARPARLSAAQLIELPDTEKMLSKTHALIEIEEGSAWVTDLDSTNGTELLRDSEFHEIPKGERSPLQPGARLQFGGAAIELVREEN